MRFDALVFLLISAGLAAPAISQDAAGTAPGDAHPVITAVSIAERADKVSVEVTFSKLVHAEVTMLEHPDRLVLDFPGCELLHTGQRLVVNRGPVLTVRAAVFSAEPQIARVVIDLKSAQEHEETYAGNKLIITLKAIGDDLPPATAGEGHRPPTNSQILAPKMDHGTGRPEAKSSDSVRPPDPPRALVGKPVSEPAARQPGAYALLDKARTLTVSDLSTLEAKAQAGEPEAETTLGLAYHAGTLLKLDDAEALRLVQHAASRGFVAAEEAMGMFSQLGYGMPPDKAQAVVWYTKAAQHGSRDATTNLALMYSTGDGIPKDSTKAANWFRIAAEAGDATAQLNVGALYHRGEGLPQDDATESLRRNTASDSCLNPTAAMPRICPLLTSG